MNTNRLWLKQDALAYAVYPQLPNFCAIAACCGALGAILKRRMTQREMHSKYEVGLFTKLKAPAQCDPSTFADRPRLGPGFSNWDIIRLSNAVLLDAGREPAGVILCGGDLAREAADRQRLYDILDWLSGESCQAIIHIPGHYLLLAGAFESLEMGGVSLVTADSAKRSGPVRLLAFDELLSLANTDERYGLVLVSDEPVPRSLFKNWTGAMSPPEVTERLRFARIDAS